MDFAFNEQETLVRDMARNFAESELMPRASKMVASSPASASGYCSSSARSSVIWLSCSSRCARTETYSPAAIERLPASRPARPASSTGWSPPPAPATPQIRLRLETRPSLTPNTAARRSLPPANARCGRSTSAPCTGE